MTETSPEDVASGSPSQLPHRSRRRTLAFVSLAVILLLIVFHVPLLQSIGDFLASSDPLTRANAAVILGGDHRYQVVAEWHEQQLIDEVWLIDERPNYLVRSAILPSSVEMGKRELINQGVPAGSLRLIGDGAVNVTDLFRMVRAHLEVEPGTRVIILCSELQGRYVRFVGEEVFGADFAGRYSIVGISDTRFDRHRWWQFRSGMKQVFAELCILGHTWFRGVSHMDPEHQMDPDEFERGLKNSVGDVACHDFPS